MTKKFILCIIMTCFILAMTGCTSNEVDSTKEGNSEESGIDLNVAVEYTDHAASFYLAQGKELFQKEGFQINDVKVYASGVGVAAAFTKGDFSVSYMCLVPAIYTYANGGVPIKIIAGTHKDGYGLVVNSSRIYVLKDLEKDGVKIANGPKGTSTDFLQMILIEKNNLDSEKILRNTVRMNAAKQLMALHNGRIDAAFVPEHFASLAASFPGMEMMVGSQDIWPDMQGSVLVVTDNFLESQPEAVEKLKKINKMSIDLINKNPQEAAETIAHNLNINQPLVKKETQSPEANLEVTPELVIKSMNNLKTTYEITSQDVQAVIDKMYDLGYITNTFDAKEIMAVN
jgi:NitT/TauT family transport system substrate-binding protein